MQINAYERVDMEVKDLEIHFLKTVLKSVSFRKVLSILKVVYIPIWRLAQQSSQKQEEVYLDATGGKELCVARKSEQSPACRNG